VLDAPVSRAFCIDFYFIWFMEVLQESAWGVRLGGFWLPAGGNVQPIMTMHLANDKQPFPPALNYKITK
jgi:hypothetical protein